MKLACFLAGLFASVCCVAATGHRCVPEEERTIPREWFVQGLEFNEDELWLSSGLYGRSRLLRLRFEDLSVIEERHLPPGLFAEGVTLAQDRVIQLTWRSGIALVWHQDPLSPKGSFRIQGQGWGLTHHDSTLIYSDGSHRLRFLDASDFRPQSLVEVRESGRPIARLNELEWIDGRIWANVWQSEDLVVIDPETGEVEARIDCSGLLPLHLRRADTDVFNGIAYHSGDRAVWVTGKRWPRLYRIRVEPPLKPAAGAAGSNRASRTGRTPGDAPAAPAAD